MPFYRQIGDIPHKRHTVFCDEHGHRYAEELMGQEGFSSRSALLYHRHSPSAIVAVEPVDDPIVDALSADNPLTPRHLRTGDIASSTDLVLGRRVLLGNTDVRISWTRADGGGPDGGTLYRNATGDELVYIQEGTTRLDSVFGSLEVGPGDYVVIPASTTHRWVHDGEVAALIVESRGHIAPPRRYLSSGGQFLEHAPYCERDLRAPTEPLRDDGEEVPVIVRNQAGLTRHIHRHHPFDVVGWDGHLYPWVLNIADFEPIVGRIHQPPPVHQTFEGPGFVVCSFVPRLYDFHPEAVKVPYHHANTDSDEVLFYSDGDFMSRAGSGIGIGSISYHPMGFVHGPQPGSHEASLSKDRTEETAVMIDTFTPLQVSDTARAASDPDYPWSWARR